MSAARGQPWWPFVWKRFRGRASLRPEVRVHRALRQGALPQFGDLPIRARPFIPCVPADLAAWWSRLHDTSVSLGCVASATSRLAQSLATYVQNAKCRRTKISGGASITRYLFRSPRLTLYPTRLTPFWGTMSREHPFDFSVRVESEQERWPSNGLIDVFRSFE